MHYMHCPLVISCFLSHTLFKVHTFYFCRVKELYKMPYSLSRNNISEIKYLNMYSMQ